MNKNIKIGILGYYGVGNLGDEAILQSILNGLSSISNQISPVVFSSKPDETSSTHSVKAVPSILPGNFIQNIVRRLGRNRADYTKVIDELKSLDLLLVGGGGLLFDHPGNNQYLLELLTKIKFAQKFKIPTAFFGIGAGPIYCEGSKTLLKQILPTMELIVVRDQNSAKLLENIAGHLPNLFVTRDLVFCLEKDGQGSKVLISEAIPDTEIPKLAIVLHGEAGVLGNEHLRVVKSSIQEFRKLQKCEVWFLPMQIDNEINDLKPALEIAESGDRIFQGGYPPSTMIDILSRAKLTLAVRLHGSILSICAGVPFIGISYAKKVKDLYESIAASHLQIGLEEISQEQLTGLLVREWKNPSLPARINDLRLEAKKSFELLESSFENLQIVKY